MKYDALIFDVDGTLWDSCPAIAEAWNIAIKALGASKRITAEQMAGVAGKPFAECVQILLPNLYKENPELLKILENSEIENLKSKDVIFYDQVLTGIPQLAKSHEIFLVSNCQSWYMQRFLQFSKLEPHLSGYDCHGMSNQPKHEMLTRMVKKHYLQNPIYIGDTAGDQTAAHLANIDFIHASYGFGTAKNPSKTIASFEEILENLKS